MKMLRSVTDRLELGVVEAPDGGNSIDLHVAETLAALSIAISLKRIADAADRVSRPGVVIDLPNLFFNAGQDFAHGMRGRG